MKNRIIVNSGHDVLNFYLVNKCGTYYLFTQHYTRGVFEYFRNGRSENELRAYRGWNKNPRLDKTIEKLPMYVKFVMREYVMDDMARRAELLPTREAYRSSDEREAA